MIKDIQLDGFHLRCDVLEKPGAPALLFLNPLAASLEIWDGQIAELGREFTLVRFDARGHGESQVGPLRELSMERLAQDALAVLDAVGIERAHVCGLSIGGMTAMKLATLAPERVNKLILCCTTPYMPTVQTWQERIAIASSQGVAALVDGILQRWFAPRFRAAEPKQVERVRAMLLKTSAAGFVASAAAIRDMDQRETIRAISAPTLVIAGAQDAGIPPAQAELILRAIRGSRLTVLDSAHVPNVEQREAFNATVLEFLKQ
ncbi:MAG TPA: 3-oxoadipate enol-lactonase [Steroidobacteraceae bacterium]|nr:3-oxoadipate enol-lactonase [Steroidobacteraceae bacterium]